MVEPTAAPAIGAKRTFLDPVWSAGPARSEEERDVGGRNSFRRGSRSQDLSEPNPRLAVPLLQLDLRQWAIFSWAGVDQDAGKQRRHDDVLEVRRLVLSAGLAPPAAVMPAAEKLTGQTGELHRAVLAICAGLKEARDHLTDLEQVVGDGDIGISLARGAAAIEIELDGYDSRSAAHHPACDLSNRAPLCRRHFGSTLCAVPVARR